MEPHESEVEAELAEEFVNRTGIMTNPEMSAELIQGVEELTPASDDDAAEIAEMRAEYLEDAVPIGSEPFPVQDSDSDEELPESTEALMVLLDKLGERLAFERQGTRLYEAFLQKIELLGFEEESGPTGADLRHICDDEFEHFRMLQQIIVKLGGDATVKTPSADVAGVLSKGAAEIVVDPRTTVAHCLQAILTAELADNDGWQMLSQLAGEFGLDELESQCQTALGSEQEHLENVRKWLLAATIEEAQSGSEIGDDMELEELDKETDVPDATEESNKPDPLELLKQNHGRVKKLFKE
jgi:hypothetical protein